MIVYNHGPYIIEAMEAVLMQETDFGVELVISNDCSSDNTHNLIEQFIQQYKGTKTIKYILQEQNIGMMPNFVFTLQQCSGKYIAVCEGDDYWTDPLKLQKQVSLLEKEEHYSMVITNRKVWTEHNNMVDECYEKEHKKNIFTIKDVVNGFVPGMQTILFRNFPSLVDYFSAHPEYYYADRYLTYFCSLFGDIYLIPEVMAVYRMTGSGVWSVHTPIQKLQTYTTFMNDFHHSLGIPANNEILASIGFNTSYTCLKYGMKRPGLLMKKDYRKIITKPWADFSKINRIKMFWSVVFNRKSK